METVRRIPVGEKIYWTSPLQRAIFRSNLDGTNSEPFLSGIDIPYDIAVLQPVKSAAVPELSSLVQSAAIAFGMLVVAWWRQRNSKSTRRLTGIDGDNALGGRDRG